MKKVTKNMNNVDLIAWEKVLKKRIRINTSRTPVITDIKTSKLSISIMTQKLC